MTEKTKENLCDPTHILKLKISEIAHEMQSYGVTHNIIFQAVHACNRRNEGLGRIAIFMNEDNKNEFQIVGVEKNLQSLIEHPFFNNAQKQGFIKIIRDRIRTRNEDEDNHGPYKALVRVRDKKFEQKQREKRRLVRGNPPSQSEKIASIQPKKTGFANYKKNGGTYTVDYAFVKTENKSDGCYVSSYGLSSPSNIATIGI